MSGEHPSEAKPKFACEKEAAKLLNCIASGNYVEQKCVTYLKNLRKCVQKEGVVGFNLLPDSEPSSSTEPQEAQRASEDAAASASTADTAAKKSVSEYSKDAEAQTD